MITVIKETKKMAYLVHGILKKTFVASVGGYKYHVGQGVKAFESATDAQLYADKVEDLTGVILTIK